MTRLASRNWLAGQWSRVSILVTRSAQPCKSTIFAPRLSQICPEWAGVRTRQTCKQAAQAPSASQAQRREDFVCMYVRAWFSFAIADGVLSSSCRVRVQAGFECRTTSRYGTTICDTRYGDSVGVGSRIDEHDTYAIGFLDISAAGHSHFAVSFALETPKSPQLLQIDTTQMKGFDLQALTSMSYVIYGWENSPKFFRQRT